MVRGARKEGLSRRHRFVSQGAFGPVLRSSRKLRGPLAVVHVASGRPGASRIGIALTRRMTPSSLCRNRIKRLVRELFRRHDVKRSGLDLVIALRGSVAPGREAELRAELRAAMDQLVEKG